MYSITTLDRNSMPVVTDIATRTWYTAYREILRPEQIRYMLEEMYRQEVLLARQDRGNLFYLIETEEQGPSGFAEIELHYEGSADTKLHKIYVLPEAQGQQLGAGLLDHIKSVAQQHRQQGILLHVNRYNKARFFYERQGFEIIREEDIDIGNGYYMNDYVMRYTF